MDEVGIWIGRKKRESGLSEIPINDTIEKYILETERLRLIGEFYESWSNESYTNSLILEQFFILGKINESNAYSKTIDITEEQQRLIYLEENYNRAILRKDERNQKLHQDYLDDFTNLGSTVAKRNKGINEKTNENLNKADDAIITNYNNEVQRAKTEMANAILISKQRQKEKAETDRVNALKAKQDSVKASVLVSRANETKTVDTPMTIYLRNKSKADTANEMNESTQSTYKHDLVYLFFKCLLFFILVGVFYYLMKDQNPTEIINKVKDTTKVVADKVSEGVKTIKETVREKGNEIMKGNEGIKG
jgi:hypothetical protein